MPVWSFVTLYVISSGALAPTRAPPSIIVSTYCRSMWADTLGGYAMKRPIWRHVWCCATRSASSSQNHTYSSRGRIAVLLLDNHRPDHVPLHDSRPHVLLHRASLRLGLPRVIFRACSAHSRVGCGRATRRDRQIFLA